MEHGALTVELGNAASANLVATYFALGGATPGATIWKEDGFTACVGPFEHPICNFAMNLALDPWSARRLHDIAITRSSFNVFSLPNDAPEHRDELLTRAGFRQTYQLFQLVAEPEHREQPLELMAAREYGQRLAIADFMADQFFARQPQSFRRRMALATAASPTLELFALQINGNCEGAVMVLDAGGALGIYNLCVSSAHRGMGWGAAIVSSVLARAAAEMKPVTLQCDERLQGWYYRFGFRSVGVVQVYGLFDSSAVDIIQLTT